MPPIWANGLPKASHRAAKLVKKVDKTVFFPKNRMLQCYFVPAVASVPCGSTDYGGGLNGIAVLA